MACSLQHLSRHSFNALTGLSCYALAGGIALSSTAFQCPLGLIPHFYDPNFHILNRVQVSVNALSGLYLISTKIATWQSRLKKSGVNALSDLYLISTRKISIFSLLLFCVNALSGLYLISTYQCVLVKLRQLQRVSMPSRAYTSFLRIRKLFKSQFFSLCQCPLGPIPHFYGTPSKT